MLSSSSLSAILILFVTPRKYLNPIDNFPVQDIIILASKISNHSPIDAGGRLYHNYSFAMRYFMLAYSSETFFIP
jgi:hypothetical protein